MKLRTNFERTVPALLVALSVVPALGGVVRLMSVSRDVTVTTDSARFLAAPTPVVIHIATATLFSLLGAFQFSRGFRLRWPRFHRRAGEVLVLCGLAAALSGMWMTAFYRIPPHLQGSLLFGVRLVVGSAMTASILAGCWSIVRGNVPGHEAWMIRAYALGQGAATQVLVLLPWMLLSGESGGLTRDLLMTLAWLINVGLAEAIISRRKSASGDDPLRA